MTGLVQGAKLGPPGGPPSSEHSKLAATGEENSKLAEPLLACGGGILSRTVCGLLVSTSQLTTDGVDDPALPAASTA